MQPEITRRIISYWKLTQTQNASCAHKKHEKRQYNEQSLWSGAVLNDTEKTRSRQIARKKSHAVKTTKVSEWTSFRGLHTKLGAKRLSIILMSASH